MHCMASGKLAELAKERQKFDLDSDHALEFTSLVCDLCPPILSW